MKKLTRRQSEIMYVITTFLQGYGRPPTIHELAREIGVTPVTAKNHLRAVAKKGHISFDGEHIVVLEKDTPLARVIYMLSKKFAKHGGCPLDEEIEHDGCPTLESCLVCWQFWFRYGRVPMESDGDK